MEIKYSLEASTRDVKTIVKASTRENVSLFLNESFENVLICIISIGPSGTFRLISNFRNFCQNKNSLELLNIIFENSSPIGSFWAKKKRCEFSLLSPDSRKLLTTALNPQMPVTQKIVGHHHSEQNHTQFRPLRNTSPG